MYISHSRMIPMTKATQIMVILSYPKCLYTSELLYILYFKDHKL